MEFKIDTKDTFTIIVPINEPISAKLTDAIEQKCGEMRQSGRKNYIVDFRECVDMDKTAVPGMIRLHENCYSNDESLVYTGISKSGINILKEDEADLLINIAPTMQEAIDIISMEILERDLFNEE
jgi:anti-anti-sigma regulatory factor